MNRKRPIDMKSQGNRNSKRPISFVDEEIESSDDDDLESEGSVPENDSESIEETPEQLRKRLAKSYLASVTKGAADDQSDSVDSADEEEVSSALRQKRLMKQGSLYRPVADKISGLNFSDDQCDIVKRYLHGHQKAVTCIAQTGDDSKVYSGSKDNSVIEWDCETGSKRIIKPFWGQAGKESTSPARDGEVLSVAVSEDGRYVVSGGRDNAIRVFDIRTKAAEIKVLRGHRDAVTSLRFRRDTYSLFSGSLDRCVKHWDLNEMGYLETCFGHQDGITALDCWTSNRPISTSSDRSIRLWKVNEDSHLVFRSKSGADCVQLLTEDTFVSGSQDGSIELWKESQKKRIASVPAAHGWDDTGRSARWICGLASIKMSDLVCSGSYDGFLRFWKVEGATRTIAPVASLAVPGFINAISLSTKILSAGVGREHKLGRWWNIKGGKNVVVIARLPDSISELS